MRKAPRAHIFVCLVPVGELLGKIRRLFLLEEVSHWGGH